MKDLSKSVLAIVSWPFAFLLLAFTGYQTYTLIHGVTGSHLIAVIGLVLFEVGMLYWWAVFRNEAEGLLQMSLSLLVFLACLSFVTLATALKLGAVGNDVMGPDTPAKIITAAAVIQLAAKLFFPLFHPDVMQVIRERVQEGKILKATGDKFEKRVDGIADTFTDALVEEQTARLLTKLNLKHQTRYQLPGRAEPVVVEGQSAATEDTPRAPRPSWRDRVFGRPAQAQPAPEPQAAQPAANDDVMATIAQMVASGQLVIPVAQQSNTTHAAPTAVSAAPTQPNGPTAKPLARGDGRP